MKNSLRITIRKTGFADIEFLWYLRNQPDVYKYSRVSRAVEWKEHIDWILPILLGLSDKELFIIEDLKNPIGQIRFDYNNQNGIEVSISILKEFRGKGIATRSLDLVIKKIRQQKKVRAVMAEIHQDNIPSQKLFEKLDFKLKEQKGPWLKYILEV